MHFGSAEEEGRGGGEGGAGEGVEEAALIQLSPEHSPAACGGGGAEEGGMATEGSGIHIV